MKRSNVGQAAAVFAAAGLASTALAQVIHDEVEPNDTKAQALANGVLVLNPGDGVRGISTGTSTTVPGDGSADYYLIQTPSQPPGIYKWRMSVDLAGTTATLRGLTQSNGVPNPTSDATVQTGTTVSGIARTVQWYGFGRQERAYFRVTGVATSTGQYMGILQPPEAVTPTDLGTFEAGTIEISTKGYGSNGDTKLWVFDSNLSPIPDFGNSNQPAPGDGVRSRLTRTFTPGTYYLALGLENVAVPVPAATDDRLRTSAVTDFPDLVIGSNTSTNVNMNFAMTDQFGPVVTPATIPTGNANPFTVLWYQFTVGTVTSNLGACCLPDGTCAIQRGDSCTTRQGIFSGAGTTCGVTPCAQPGACCIQLEGCLNRSMTQCSTAGGVYSGDGTSCGAPPCVTPVKRIETFTADQTHLFTPSGSFLNFPSFGGRGMVSSTVTTGTPLLVTGSWGFACSISAAGLGSPTPNIMASTNGGVVYDFNDPISKFGIYLGSNAAANTSCTVEFFTAQGSLGTTAARFDNDCGWNFNAFEFTAPVNRVIIRSNPNGTGAGGYVQQTLPQVVWRVEPPQCYANCDGSTGTPVLNVNDFVCFQGRFAAADPYADCDQSSSLNVNDFVCFQSRFAAGCR